MRSEWRLEICRHRLPREADQWLWCFGAFDAAARAPYTQSEIGFPPVVLIMTVTVKTRSGTPLVVPPSVRRQAGHKNGQDLEFRVSGGVITILPKLPIANDEYTPEQRRVIDARLAEGPADSKAGRTFGPFHSADQMIAHMKTQVRKRATAAKAKRSR